MLCLDVPAITVLTPLSSLTESHCKKASRPIEDLLKDCFY